MKRPLRIVITTGDADGIGTEVAARALQKLKPQKDVQFILWRSPTCPKAHLNRIDSVFERTTVTSWPEALRNTPRSYKELIDINSHLSPAVWVETTATAANFGHIDALATGPLSKTEIVRAGLKDIGHTDILKRVSKTDAVFMGFLGKEFSVLLTTGHLPIRKVPAAWTEERLLAAVESAFQWKQVLPKTKSSKPIAVLALNPHAGEDGLIGAEEDEIFQKVRKKLEKRKIEIVGPLIPDVAFLKTNWKKFSIFVCAYHDQGLIPFKTIHGHESGVHISFGLPFVRTSVDHGTAKDIFGKNKADYHSMLEAIQWSIQLAQWKRKDKFQL